MLTITSGNTGTPIVVNAEKAGRSIIEGYRAPGWISRLDALSNHP